MDRQTVLRILEIETEHPTKNAAREAYIRQIKKNHPNHFFRASTQTQKITESNAKLINEARETLVEWVSFNDGSPMNDYDISKKKTNGTTSINFYKRPNERSHETQQTRKSQEEKRDQSVGQESNAFTNSRCEPHANKRSVEEDHPEPNERVMWRQKKSA